MAVGGKGLAEVEMKMPGQKQICFFIKAPKFNEMGQLAEDKRCSF